MTTTATTNPATTNPATTNPAAAISESSTGPSPQALSKPQTIISWIAQLVAAGILGMTLPFKFTYAQDTAEIFAQLGGRPFATVIGLFELVAVVFILFPKTIPLGALLSLGLMGGAIASHVLVIGFEGVAGEMFAMAIVVTIAASIVLLLRRQQLFTHPLIQPIASKWLKRSNDV